MCFFVTSFIPRDFPLGAFDEERSAPVKISGTADKNS